MFQDGSYYNLEERIQKSLFRKFKLLYQRIGKMQLTLGLKTASIALAFMLVSKTVNAQIPQQWIENKQATAIFNAGISNGTENIVKFVDIDNDGDEDLFLGGTIYTNAPPYGEKYTYKFYENKGISSEELFADIDNPDDPILPMNLLHYNPSFIDFIDNDGDNDLDVYATNPANSGTIDFYKNTGTQSAPQFELTTGTENKFASLNDMYSLAFEDIDGDDDLDAVFNHNDGTFHYYKNDAGVFNEQSCNNPFSSLNIYHSVFDFLDLDGDDDLDAIAKNCNNLTFLEQNECCGNIYFNENSSNNPISGDYGSGLYPSFVDLDEDDDMDLIVSNFEAFSFNLMYHENDNNDFTYLGHPLLIPTPIDLQRPKFIDIDGDGDLDLYADNKYSYMGGNDHIYKNIGDNEIPLWEPSMLESFGLPNIDYSTEAFIDIDDDGDIDMFALQNNYYGYGYPDTALFYKNVGTATVPDFQLQDQSNNPLSVISDFGNMNILAFADIDGDGDFDAVLGDQENDPVITVYKNTGTKEVATFVEVSYSENPFDGTMEPYNIEFADIDEDGDQDLIFGTYSYTKGSDGFLLFNNISDESNINFEAVNEADNPLSIFNPAFGGFAFTNLFNEDEHSIIIREMNDMFGPKMPPPPPFVFDINRYYTLKDLLSIDEKTYDIDENSGVNTYVGKVVSEYYGIGTVSFSIESGNTDEAFYLDENIILVNTSSALDYEIEANRSFNLTIQATDETYTTSATYTINLNDLTETSIAIQEKDKFKIYPNPASNDLNIIFGSDITGPVLVNIINSVGKVVKEKTFENNSECKLNVSNLNNGIYFIQIMTKEETITQKILIQ